MYIEKECSLYLVKINELFFCKNLGLKMNPSAEHFEKLVSEILKVFYPISLLRPAWQVIC